MKNVYKNGGKDKMSKFLDGEGLGVLWELIKESESKIILRGYLRDGKFYETSEYITELVADPHRIYININNGVIYNYDNVQGAYISINDVLPTAKQNIDGVMKLYAEKGQNMDGTMTQKAITDSLNTKVEAGVEGETLILSISE